MWIIYAVLLFSCANFCSGRILSNSDVTKLEENNNKDSQNVLKQNNINVFDVNNIEYKDRQLSGSSNSESEPPQSESGQLDCKDSLPENVCQTVFKTGMCDSKQIYSKQICARTCGFCSSFPPPPPSPPPTPKCFDKLSKSFCENIRHNNYCTDPAMNTKITCNQTCGYCHDNGNTFAPPPPPSICRDNADDSFCESVFQNDLCFSNDIDFSNICRLTCQFCELSPPPPPMPPYQGCNDEIVWGYCDNVKLYDLCLNPMVNANSTCRKTCGFCSEHPGAAPHTPNSSNPPPSQRNPKKFSRVTNMGILSWSSVLIVWGIVSGIAGIYSTNNCCITIGVVNLSLSVALLGFALDEVMLLIQHDEAQFIMLIFLATFNIFMTLLMGVLGINAVCQRRLKENRDSQQEESLKTKLNQKTQDAKCQQNYEDYIFGG